MTPVSTDDSVRASLAKARQFLNDARANLRMRRLETSLDRAYYAMYHAARAILQHRGVPLPKTHSGLRSVFGRELVKKGIISQHFYESLAKGAQMREEVTYTVYVQHGTEVAEELLRETDGFVRMAQGSCRKRRRGSTANSSKAA